MNLKIIYFSSPGCSICNHQLKILQEINSEYNIEIEDHLITTSFDTALKLGVKSAPTLAYIQEEKVQLLKTGFQSKNQILEIIDQISETFC